MASINAAKKLFDVIINKEQNGQVSVDALNTIARSASDMFFNDNYGQPMQSQNGMSRNDVFYQSNKKIGDNLRNLIKLVDIPVNAKGKIKTLFVTTKGGYLRTSFSHHRKKEFVSVHRLVAKNFIPNDDVLKNEVNHKNGIKTDNRAENLEWVTKSENLLHKYRVLGHKNMSLANYMKTKCKKIHQIDINTNEILNTFDSTVSAAMYMGGRHKKCSIIAAANGKYTQSNGYKWVYDENFIGMEK